MGLQQFNEVVAILAYKELQNSDGTAYVQVNTTYPFAARFDVLYCQSTDSIDHYVQVAVSNGVDDAAIGTVLVPAGAGLTNVPAVNAVAVLVPATIGGIILPQFNQLVVRTSVAVTSGQVLYFTASGGFVA